MVHNIRHDYEAWPYTVTVAPVSTPVTLAEVKEQLRIDAGDATQDTLLTVLINAATGYAEKYTKRDFITRTYETMRDSFSDRLELRRCPVQSVESVSYLKNDTPTIVATSVYFLTVSNTYSSLALKAGQSWPTDEDLRQQAVTITFKAGYGDLSTNVPNDIRQGLLEHISYMYENRGDCAEEILGGSDVISAERFLPLTSRMIYDMYKVRSIR